MTETQLQVSNPNKSIFDLFEVDKGSDKVERAHNTWRMLLSAKNTHDGLFLVIGKLLKDVRDDKLYTELDYENFSQFLASEELSFGREKAYQYIKTYEFYIEYLNLNENYVGKLNIGRLSMMVPVLKHIEDKKEILEQMDELSSLRHGDFVRKVRQTVKQSSKPSTYWSKENDHWVVNYYENVTHLVGLGDYEEKKEEKTTINSETY